MGIYIKTNTLIDNRYRKIRLCDSYEEILHKIMNDSKVVFPSCYTHIPSAKQSNGEPDFYDNSNRNIVFDAKILFSEELCKDLSKEAFHEFVNKLNEYIEFDVVKQRRKGPYNMPIFLDMKEKIGKLSGNEKGILFLPFPVTFKQSNYITSHFSDVFDYCFNFIETKHEIYIICLNKLNEVVLSKLGKDNKIEFITNTYFNDLVWVDSLEYRID